MAIATFVLECHMRVEALFDFTAGCWAIEGGVPALISGQCIAGVGVSDGESDVRIAPSSPVYRLLEAAPDRLQKGSDGELTGQPTRSVLVQWWITPGAVGLVIALSGMSSEPRTTRQLKDQARLGACPQ
jgi:hypothetical protein